MRNYNVLILKDILQIILLQETDIFVIDPWLKIGNSCIIKTSEIWDIFINIMKYINLQIDYIYKIDKHAFVNVAQRHMSNVFQPRFAKCVCPYETITRLH